MTLVYIHTVDIILAQTCLIDLRRLTCRRTCLWLSNCRPSNFKGGAAFCSEEQNTNSAYTFCIGYVVKVSQQRQKNSDETEEQVGAT